MDWQTITSAWGFNLAFLVGTLLAIYALYLTFKSRPVSRLAYDSTNLRKPHKVDFGKKEEPELKTFTENWAVSSRIIHSPPDSR